MRAPSRYLALLTIVVSTILSTVLFIGAPFGVARAEDGPPSGQGGSEKRIALVVGNAAYRGGALATPANDAGLIAQTLQAAGFDVVGARDLDEDSLRKAMRDFTDKAAASGPDTVAFVYLAGYGLQLNGENYFAPIDAAIASAADVPVQSLRISDYKRRLASLPLKARFIVVDGARQNPFVKQGDPLAGGLALTEAEPGSLVAFNAAPGTIGPEEKGSYGAYAQALVEMIREGGLPPDQVFDRVRLRVSETTQGAEVPWHASRLEGQFVFFQREAGAPVVAEPAQVAAFESRPLRELGAKEAYTACLKRDTLQGYQEFVAAYPRDTLAKRARALVAARRESVTWRKTFVADNPDAYWSYLRRYPRGPHAYDCRRRLRELSVALEPPARFTELDYDLPPPPPEEIVYVERPVVYFADPVYDLPPPPPPPAFFLPPPPAYIVDLAPPPPVYVEYALPTPAFVPLPVYVDPPRYVAPPPNNIYYQNIHNVTVINRINEQNVVYARQQRDRERGPGAGGPDAAPPAGAAYGGAGLAGTPARVALPPALAQKAAARTDAPSGAVTRDGPQQPRNGSISNLPVNAQPGAPQPNRPGQPGQALPGQTNGQPLPQQANRPGLAKEPGAATTKGDARPDDRADPRQANRPDAQDKLRPGRDENDPKRQAIKPGDPDAKGDARPDAKPDPRQAGRPDPQDKLRPGRDETDPKRQAIKPGDPDAKGDARPDAKPDPRQANRPDPQDKLRPGRDETDPKRQAIKPGDPDAKGDARPDAKPDPRQANRPDPQDKLRPGREDAAAKRQADRPDGLPGARGGENRLPAIGGRPPAGADRDSAAARAQDAQQQRMQAQEQRRQALEQQRGDRQQAAQQQRQQAVEQRQQAAQQAAAQRQQQQQQRLQADQAERAQAAAQQRQQAMQERAAQQQAAQAQRQQAAQQAAAQQRAQAQQAAAAERAQAAAQQRAAAQQQQMMQQRQMQQQAAQQQAAQQRQMMQQQAAQRQQMMQQQRQPPPGMPMR